ncbi:MAG: DUF2155 domain-containing protein [Holosporaceae bacterium]|jgi:hypothetical protein|nr:DUF2155 domain-containing protein [Holosporaceae bacterium]
MRKINLIIVLLVASNRLLFFEESNFVVFGRESSEHKALRRSIKDVIQNEDFDDEKSIWESKPIEIHHAKIQILDKISGKVFRRIIKTNESIVFGTIELKLKKCFKNSPEDNNEIYAFIEIMENGKVIFSNWLFASSPSINLLAHPVYDIRVEF